VPVDCDVAQRAAAEPRTCERLTKFVERQVELPRHVFGVHVIVANDLHVREGGSLPDLGCSLRPAAAGGGIEHFGGRAIDRQDTAGRRQRRPPRALVRRAKNLAMDRVTQIESFAPVTSHLHARVGPDGDRERLSRGVRRIGFPFAGKHTCDVHLEWNAVDTTLTGRPDDDRAPTADSLQLFVGDLGLRSRRRRVHHMEHHQRACTEQERDGPEG
jgi:hypothetical protein